MRRTRITSTVLLVTMLQFTAGGSALAQSAAVTEVQDAIAARTRLIASTAPSIELLQLMAAQVEDHLRLISLPGHDLALLYGVSTDAEREQVSTTARIVIDLAQRAIGLSDEIVERSARDAAFGRDSDEEGERARQQAIHVTEVQLPLRIARAELLLGFASVRTEERAAHARRAAEVLGSLEPVSDWSEASKHLLTGLGERLEARDDRGAKECRAAFDLVTRADDAALQARLGAECALALALAQSDISQPGKARETLDSVRGKPPFVTDTGLDRFWQLALADAWMRVGLTEAARLEAGPLRNAAATRALARHEELAAGGDRALRNASLARVGLACTPTMSYADLPGLAGVAWVMRQREQNVPGAALMPLLTQVAGRADVQPHWRADAALIAAEIARDADDVEAAADWYLQAAHLEPDPATSESLLLEALSWVTAQASAPEQVVIRVLRALDASSITTRDVDRWRIHLAQLLVRRYAQGDPEATRADVLEAAAVLGRVSERSSARDDAATMRATVWRVALQVATGRGAEGGGTVPPAERFEIEFAAERLLEAAVTPTSQPWRLEALVALQRYDEVLAEAASRPPMSLEGLESEFEAAWGADRIDLLPDLAERIGAHGPGAARVIRTIADDLWAQIEPRTRFMLDVEPAGATDRALLQAMTAVREYCVASWPAALPVQTDRLAWTQLVSGDATGAGATFTGLIDAQGARRGWLLGVGEAAFRAGDASSAFEAFRRVAQACESSDQQERDYWHAWVRMLQILDARGGQAERIRREVERLAWLDSAQAYDAYLQRARQLVR